MPSLNQRQQQAVEATEGALLLLAGPGTGKTTVIAERFAHIVGRGLARPDEILTLTFSRKTAGEMTERIIRRLDCSFASLPVSTFHSFCLRLILRHHELLGYKRPPDLVTGQEQWQRVASLLEAADASRMPVFGRLLGRRTLTQDVLDFILRCEEYGQTSDDLSRLARTANRSDWLELAPIMAAYGKELREDNRIDYGLIIQQAVELLREHASVRERVRRTYRYVMVDEYQDTNLSQDQLLKLIVGPSGNICVVGDPAQSIYAFRGTTIANIETFQSRFNARRITLQESYRSPQPLVDLACRVIGYNGDHRILHATQDFIPEIQPYTFATREEQNDWVAQEVQRLHAYEGVRYGNIAVLLRTVKGHVADLEDALRRRRIPYVVTGGGSVLDVPGVRDLVRLLEIAAGDESPDALRSALASPLFDRDPFSLPQLDDDPLESLARSDDEALQVFAALIVTLREIESTNESSRIRLPSLLFHIWVTLPPLRDLVIATDETSALTVRAITAFYDSVVRFAERRPEVTLTAYLDLIRSVDYTDDLGFHDSIGADAVYLGSIHAAKGLEFEAVLLPDLTEGACPSSRRDDVLADLSVLNSGQPLDIGEREANHLEEERRIFYVGVTRARRYLYLLAAADGGQLSRFVGEAWGDPAYEPSAPARDHRLLSLASATAEFRRRYRDPEGAQAEHALALLGLALLPNLDPSTWWCNVAATTNTSPSVLAPLRTSVSRLATYEDCPLRYRRSSIDRLADGGSPAASFGTIIHTVLDRVLPQRLTHEEALHVLDDEWDDAIFRFKPVAAERKRDAETILDHLYAYLDAGGWPEVLYTESDFTFVVAEHTIAGRIDRIDRLEGGGLRLVDYKTGVEKSREQAEADLQLALYFLACHLVPELRTLGRPEELQYVYLARPQKKQFSTRRQIASLERLPEIQERVQGLLQGIIAEQFEPRLCDACRYCAYKIHCPLQPEGQLLETDG